MIEENRLIEPFIVPDPVAVRLPVTEKSYPLNMAAHQEHPIDLAAYGYVEEEYLVSGKANVYAWKDTDGRPLVRSTGAPYCTRIIVRKPADPARFSGSVMVDCMHGGCKIDNPSIGWGSAFEHIVASGDGYVGLSVAGTTFKALKTFDPERYAPLCMPNPLPPEKRGPVGNMASSPDQIKKNGGTVLPDDPTTEKGLDMDIFSQVSALIKRGKPGSPFEGMNAKRTYILGVTFAEIPCYVSAVLPYSFLEEGKPIYDGAMVYMSGRAGNINREEGALSWDDPRCKCGGPVPVVRLQTAGDIRGTLPHPLWASMFRSPNCDEPGNISRTYEIAGASLRFCARGDLHVYPSQAEIDRAGVSQENHKPNSLRGFRDGAEEVSIMQHIITGIYRNMKEWSINGTPLPIADYLDITGPYPDTDFHYDENGNQKGGVRNHYVDVPVATYVDDGTIIPFSAEKLKKLYGSRENWLKLTAECLERMVKDRWILPEGAQAMLKEAQNYPYPEI